MCWSIQWSDKLDFLLEMKAKGRPVPALDDRPELPEHCQILRTLYNDVVNEGVCRFSEFCLWCDRFGVDDPVQFEYLWDAVNIALSTVQKWRKSPSSNSGKTTGTTPTPAAGSPAA